VVLEVVFDGILGPVGWAGLLALGDDLDGITSFTSVCELLELPNDLKNFSLVWFKKLRER
jgi:hypothetical protein